MVLKKKWCLVQEVLKCVMTKRKENMGSEERNQEFDTADADEKAFEYQLE